jgi:hypothetical protein
MRLQFLDYRFAEAVLGHETFGTVRTEIVDIFQAAPVPLLNPIETNPRQGGVKRRARSGGRYLFLPVDQKAMNTYLDGRFNAKGWELQPLIVSRGRDEGPTTGLKGDYKKGRVQVEVQFGNMARWYTDVFKFQLSYSLGEIDVGVLVVPMLSFANLIDENVVNFERVSRELPWAKMSLTLPIWVVGIEPDDYGSIRDCYDAAAAALSQAQPGSQAIPFDKRLVEAQEDEEPEESAPS